MFNPWFCVLLYGFLNGFFWFLEVLLRLDAYFSRYYRNTFSKAQTEK